jgi:hypothetical protein
MSMLACARRRVQSVLPRPFAFSTTVPKQDAENSTTKELESILRDTADRVSPVIPGMSQSDQSV